MGADRGVFVSLKRGAVEDCSLRLPNLLPAHLSKPWASRLQILALHSLSTLGKPTYNMNCCSQVVYYKSVIKIVLNILNSIELKIFTNV